MKVIIHNTGFEADGIAAGAQIAMDADQAQALVEKWGGMMKLVGPAQIEGEAAANTGGAADEGQGSAPKPPRGRKRKVEKPTRKKTK